MFVSSRRASRFDIDGCGWCVYVILCRLVVWCSLSSFLCVLLCSRGKRLEAGWCVSLLRLLNEFVEVFPLPLSFC